MYLGVNVVNVMARKWVFSVQRGMRNARVFIPSLFYLFGENGAGYRFVPNPQALGPAALAATPL